jgi:hypothetical protein
MDRVGAQIHGKPTQKPLNREEQKQQFDSLKRDYQFAKETPPTPVFPVEPVKDIKPSFDKQLETYKQRLTEYGIQPEIQKVEKHQEEVKTTTTINQFYCKHTYNAVRANFMGMPMRYKICSKCGLVK